MSYDVYIKMKPSAYFCTKGDYKLTDTEKQQANDICANARRLFLQLNVELFERYFVGVKDNFNESFVDNYVDIATRDIIYSSVLLNAELNRDICETTINVHVSDFKYKEHTRETFEEAIVDANKNISNAIVEIMALTKYKGEDGDSAADFASYIRYAYDGIFAEIDNMIYIIAKARLALANIDTLEQG